MVVDVYKATTSDNFPADVPWRARTTCPWTGEEIVTAGSDDSGALYAMGKALTARKAKYPDDPKSIAFSVNMID